MTLSCLGFLTDKFNLKWFKLPDLYMLTAKASQERRKESFYQEVNKIIVVKQWYMPNKKFCSWKISVSGLLIYIGLWTCFQSWVLICRKYFSRLNSTQYNYIYNLFQISDFIGILVDDFILAIYFTCVFLILEDLGNLL